MIVALVGHVDHGKSSLVAALSGQRTDRLPEEQRRGLTIEPGYAFADLGDGAVIDLVDLPGHERYLRHLLAGVAAADAALLVVAADDGPMPQTLEHLAVLRALCITRVLPVLSKVDRVPPERAAEVRAEVERLLGAHGGAPAPAFEVDAPRGTGLGPLREQLRALHRATPPPDTAGAFRLAVDRVFTRAGAGLVVTGTALAGEVQTGDELRIAPAGGAVRVRGLQVHGSAVATARRGQRCALNLAPRDGGQAQVRRGDWLVAAGAWAPTRRVDVLWWPVAATQAQAPPPAYAAVRENTLQLHLGNAVRQARLVPLGAATVGAAEADGAAGDDGARFAQLLLDAPVSALHGDRFLLRDAAAQRLVGGGAVVDVFAPARGRATPQRLRELTALARPEPAQALAGLLAARAQGVEWQPFARNRNLPPDTRAALAAHTGALEIAHRDGMRLVSRAAFAALLARVPQALATQHAREPASRGLSDAELHRALATAAAAAPTETAADAPLRDAALAQLRAAGTIARSGFHWHLPAHVPQLAPADAALLARTEAVLRGHGLRPPPLGELAEFLELPLPEATAFLQRAAALGHLVQIAKNRFFLPETLQALVQVARETAAASPDGRFEVIPFRDRSGIGRNLSIQVLEYFDRVRITRFVGQRRTMQADAASP